MVLWKVDIPQKIVPYKTLHLIMIYVYQSLKSEFFLHNFTIYQQT